MPVTFLIPMALRPFANGKSHIVVEEAPITLEDALEALWKRCPHMRHRVITEQAQIREHINVFVGKEDVRHTGGLQTHIADGVEISIIPAISGGSRVTSSKSVVQRSVGPYHLQLRTFPLGVLESSSNPDALGCLFPIGQL